MESMIVRNVEEAFNRLLPVALEEQRRGRVLPSRYGDVVDIGHVSIQYTRPWEAVLFNSQRDANPFFHLMEAIWMLDGRNDVQWIAEYNSRIHEFSDDGRTFNGAYGHRWKYHFRVSQLILVEDMLRKDPMTRRAVVQMYDCQKDLFVKSKDIPCNLCVVFSLRRNNCLDMTVFNRSNDIIWGMLGANAVHFPFLQSYMADRLGVRIGTYTQVSSNAHAYTATLKPYGQEADPYLLGNVCPISNLAHQPENWYGDLQVFMQETSYRKFNNTFFSAVASPMRSAWRLWKEGDKNAAVALLELQDRHIDWIQAGLRWMKRRLK